jgi:hypothetical protein
MIRSCAKPDTVFRERDIRVLEKEEGRIPATYRECGRCAQTYAARTKHGFVQLYQASQIDVETGGEIDAMPEKDGGPRNKYRLCHR